MFWGCFSAIGTERLESVQGTMNNDDIKAFWREMYRPVSESSISHRSWVLQQDNDPKPIYEYL